MLMFTLTILLESVNKHGFKLTVQPLKNLCHFNPLKSSECLSFCCITIFIVNSLLIEKAIARFKLTRYYSAPLIIGNLLALFILPIAVKKVGAFNHFGGLFVFFYTTVALLKLSSYHMVNYWFRRAVKENKNIFFTIDYLHKVYTVPEDKSLTYPNNLTFSNMCYFIIAPTLCYDLHFPRSSRPLSEKLKNLLLLVLFTFLFHILVCQIVVPSVLEILLNESKISSIAYILMRIKTIFTIQLLLFLFFYTYFHLYLNFLADITNFADRLFYRDWWNSRILNQFWRRWNLPTHKFCIRHIYMPLIARGFSRYTALFAVFLASAVFHEYLVCLSLELNHHYLGIGLIAQTPLLVLEFQRKETNKKSLFIDLFVTAFCFIVTEQVFCLYFRTYLQTHGITEMN
ncbi:diacylglycerol O-acyltransferase 1-like protein, partial [Dinothrombium tinctorium]